MLLPVSLPRMVLQKNGFGICCGYSVHKDAFFLHILPLLWDFYAEIGYTFKLKRVCLLLKGELRFSKTATLF